ncbi:glycosyltransferase [Candidatus Woesearchaeota archaeon]|nr:glycosyltransferase [Candidatus Woesearchaeota archaeon]
MKKIFFLINSLEMGGAERVITNIFPELSKKFDVTIITLKEGKFYDFDEVKIESLSKSNSNKSMFLNFPKYVYKIKKIKKLYPEAKVVSFLEIANFVNILGNKEAVISFRTNLDFFKKSTLKNSIYKFLIRKLYPKAKKIIVNSEENRLKFSKELAMDKNKIFTIYNPFIKDDVKLDDDILKIINNKIVYVTVGRLIPSKNPKLLISNFLQNCKPKDILLIVGDGPEKEKLEYVFNSDKIAFLGKRKCVQAILSKSDYFIYASEVEGFPNTLIEAMFAGLPIITTDFKTGAREIIDPELSFTKKIKYPYFGPNGCLVSLKNYGQDMVKAFKNLDKIKQEQKSKYLFEKKETIKKWSLLLK